MPMGKGYKTTGGAAAKDMGMSMGEGFSGNPKRQNSAQPKGMAGDFPGSFGHGSGSATVDGVTYEGAAAGTTKNGGNYNMVGPKARVFGSGGKMRG